MSRNEIIFSAPHYTMSVTRGDAWSLAINFPRDPGTVRAQLRDSADAETAVDLDVTPPTQVADRWRFHVGQERATAEGVFDVEITEPGGLPRTYLHCTLFLDPDVTRS